MVGELDRELMGNAPQESPIRPTRVQAVVANPQDPSKRTRLAFLVDSGAAYSVIPAAKLRKLGLEPTGERTFFLANGQLVKRKVGEARFTFEGQSATCVVLFGEEGDSTALGMTTLWNLGLMFDAIRQKIIPMPMLLAEVS
jgi:predicted aspartyl protease